MSYCRFGEADAYIFDHSSFGLYCMACSLMPLKKVNNSIFDDDAEYLINKSFCAAYDYDMMLAHVAEHRKAGDYIPKDVDERLRFERDCTHDFNNKGYCKHCFQSEVRWLHVN